MLCKEMPKSISTVAEDRLVDIDQPVFRDSRAHRDKGLGGHAGLGQMFLGKRGPHTDMGKDGRSVGNYLETK